MQNSIFYIMIVNLALLERCLRALIPFARCFEKCGKGGIWNEESLGTLASDHLFLTLLHYFTFQHFQQIQILTPNTKYILIQIHIASYHLLVSPLQLFQRFDIGPWDKNGKNASFNILVPLSGKGWLFFSNALKKYVNNHYRYCPSLFWQMLMRYFRTSLYENSRYI